MHRHTKYLFQTLNDILGKYFKVLLLFIVVLTTLNLQLELLTPHDDKWASENESMVLILHEESCLAEVSKPFDSRMLFTILRDNIPKRACTPKFNVRSELKDHQLRLSGDFDEGERCEFRCINQTKFGYQKIDEKWTAIDVNDVIECNCDNVEVKCSSNSTNTYHYLHYQLVKKPKKIVPSIGNVAHSKTAPNVHVMLLDSVAFPHFIRAMPKTLKYLRDSLNSYLFKFNNKAALNSEPNGYILYMNRLTEYVKTNPLGKPLSRMSQDQMDPCSRNTTYLPRFFKESGYRVLLNEDWTMNIHQHCSAKDESYIDEFSNTYFNHKSKVWPEFFAMKRLGPGGRSNFHSNLWEPYCHERHLHQFDYLDKFMDMYNDEPIATFSWFTYLVHDWRGDLFGYDEDFLEFFKRITPKIANSHFILLADHGNRLYEERTLRLDRLEDNNPLLLYIPPRTLLQNDQFKAQLEENSQQLVTPYDTYATLKDIAINGHFFDGMYNFSAPQPKALSDLHGSSWLRSLKQPRNCDSLHIPYEYCLCKASDKPLNISDDFKYKLASTCVKKLNKELKKNPDVRQRCEHLKLDKNWKPEVQKYGNKNVYHVDFKTTPGGGLYDGYVQVLPNGRHELISTSFPRRNAYGSQSQCLTKLFKTHTFIENYCVCKNG